MTTYLLDSNIFIQSKNFQYRFGFCQAFWDLIINLHHQGQVFSINKVKDELTEGNDELADWVKTLPKSFWLDEFDYIDGYNDVINWAQSTNFKDRAKANFADEKIADAWLVASAFNRSNTVIVTQETQVNPEARKQIKIPNAAQEFNVDCFTLYDFLSATCHNNFTPL